MAQNEYLYMLRLVRPELLSTGPTEAEAAVRERHVAYVAGLQASVPTAALPQWRADTVVRPYQDIDVALNPDH